MPIRPNPQPLTPNSQATFGGDPTPFRFGEGGRTGVLLIHGWSGSPAEMRGLGTYLAGQGLVVHGLRLPGHGTEPRDLHGVRWSHWVAAAGQELAALQATCDSVFVGGLSMGALIALYLGVTARPPVAGVIAMGAPIFFRDWRITALPLIKRVMPWYTKGPSSIRDETAPARLWHYPRLPTESIHQMSHLARETRRLLPQLRAPLLIMQGRHDTTIHPGCSPYILAHAGSADKQLLYFEESGHVIVEDLDRAVVWEQVGCFIQAHAPVPAGYRS